MDEDRSSRGDEEDEPETKPDWRVDAAASRARLRDAAVGSGHARAGGGKLVYTDEHGRQRRLPADPGQLSGAEIEAAATAMSYELGAVEASYAQIAAIERLNEMRASGAVSEEDCLREKRRILGQD